MGGTSTSTQQTQQSSTTNPWQPTQGILKDILGGIRGQVGNYQPTAAETAAINQLKTNAANLPNYAPQATRLAADLQTGGPDRGGLLTDAYSNYQKTLSPYLDPSYLDPTKSPGIQALLDTVRGDVSNSVNGQFAAAGRDLSGLNTQALARGITQAEAPVLLDQYNRNIATQQAAANSLYGAAGTTTAGLSGLDQQAFANRAQGLNVGLNTVPQAANASASGVLNAENLLRTLPLQNLQALASLVVPIAGLGGQSYGTSNTTGTQTMSPAQTVATWTGALRNLFAPGK
jgi:hypothetical protein